MKLPKLVKKRSGHIVRFDRKKIGRSLVHTLHHIKVHDHELAERLTEKVLRDISKKELEIITVDDIRQIVVKTLTQHSLERVAEAYDFVFLNIGTTKLRQVIKRDGRHVTFHPYKIFKGIRKALREVGIEEPLKAEVLTKETVEALEKRFGDQGIAPVEGIKETVEQILVKQKMKRAANAYILDRYR